VIHCIAASQAIQICSTLAGHRKKSNENLYPHDDPDIVVDERSIPA
jgi:hypothetical protein